MAIPVIKKEEYLPSDQIYREMQTWLKGHKSNWNPITVAIDPTDPICHIIATVGSFISDALEVIKLAAAYQAAVTYEYKENED